jgi:hypothetical protein
MAEVIWLHERKRKALLRPGSLLTLREDQPMRSKETKGEIIFTSICIVILLASIAYAAIA